MDWQTARLRIEENVRLNTGLNTPDENGSKCREVLAVEATIDKASYGYRDERGYIVSIGEKTKVSIPWSMLERCFSALSSRDGYSGDFFRRHYAKQAKDHPCHVHVVGMIFVKAGVAIREGTRQYRLTPTARCTTGGSVSTAGWGDRLRTLAALAVGFVGLVLAVVVPITISIQFEVDLGQRPEVLVGGMLPGLGVLSLARWIWIGGQSAP